LKNRLIINLFFYICFSFFFCSVLFFPFSVDQCRALEPCEVLVLANKQSVKSLKLAKYYMNKRGIPNENFLALTVTSNETCSRLVYEKDVAEPVKKYLKKMNPKSRIRCLLLMYGLPLKISPPVTLKSLPLKKKSGALTDTRASLDSEIALVLVKNYSLPGWISNPYYIGFKNKKVSVLKKDVLMVSRIDGSSEKIAKRIIDDSLTAENNGLQGTAYFDARWPESGSGKTSGYTFYDQSIHLASKLVKKSGLFTVVVNNGEELFKRNECPDAALYCGWYSLAKYIDSFSWPPGSIGYHIASSECTTLKKKGSRVWCKQMLDNGIAATIGPVSEPYVSAFPLPEVFFGFLVDGDLTLAECYLVSIPFLSWKMVLIGDPLYRPFNAGFKKVP